MPRLCPSSPFVAVTLLLAALGGLAAGAGPKRLHRERSAFNDILVTESARGRRVLQFEVGGDEQSVIWLDDPRGLALAYTRATMAALAVVPEPRRALMIGLGGGTMATFLHQRYPELHIDCVEIDPAVVEVAKRFFAFKPDARMRVHVGDGRRFVERSKDHYDLVILDAYGADNIPLHLATEEFLRAVRARLTPGGVVASNVIERELNPRYDDMVRTFSAVFDELYALGADANRLLFALPRRERLTRADLAQRAAKLQRQRAFGFDLAKMLRRGLEHPVEFQEGARVMRDADLASSRPAPGGDHRKKR